MYPEKKTYLIFLAISLILTYFSAHEIYGERETPVPTLPAAGEYIIGPQDVIEIKVWENPDLSGKAVVSLDGFINYYLIGKVKAEGLTPEQLRETLTRLYSNGYLINPQVSVEVAEYKSKKVVINGEVAKPGTYYLTRKMTVVEAITMAGGQTKDSDREIFIIRKKSQASETPGSNTGAGRYAKTLKSNVDSGNDIQIRIDLRAALEGNFKENTYVKNGDYIFIPKAKTFFIMGEVKSPGKYNLEKDTTLLQAISLAGGLTEKASLRKAMAIRTVDGKKEEVRLDPNDILKPGDIIRIPESLF